MEAYCPKAAGFLSVIQPKDINMPKTPDPEPEYKFALLNFETFPYLFGFGMLILVLCLAYGMANNL